LRVLILAAAARAEDPKWAEDNLSLVQLFSFPYHV
jgi:hypothetical protein